MDWLLNWAGWLSLGFLLLALELIAPGVFIMWWGLAALILAAVSALLPNFEPAYQVTIFAVLAITFSLVWWKYQHGKDQQDDEHSSLNSREHAMIGARGVIVEILENGIARGKFDDTTWRVIGENLRIGDSVQVFRVEGITLFVKK
ncbi:NfeD family protein [Bibersteinia trehalosi]|uniref:NfeD family protein n=1 Tax=Bibersteinia trehalosi TaxID=47735 RepID=UPI004045219D